MSCAPLSVIINNYSYTCVQARWLRKFLMDWNKFLFFMWCVNYTTHTVIMFSRVCPLQRDKVCVVHLPLSALYRVTAVMFNAVLLFLLFTVSRMKAITDSGLYRFWYTWLSCHWFHYTTTQLYLLYPVTVWLWPYLVVHVELSPSRHFTI